MGNVPDPGPPTLTVSLAIVLVASAALILWNAYCINCHGGEHSISYRLQTLGFKYPIVPIVLASIVAYLFGHWWPIFGNKP
jgi:hypothetical protein